MVYRVALKHENHPEDACHYGPAFDQSYPATAFDVTGEVVTDLLAAARKCAVRAAAEYTEAEGWTVAVVQLVDGQWNEVA